MITNENIIDSDPIAIISKLLHSTTTIHELNKILDYVKSITEVQKQEIINQSINNLNWNQLQS